MKISILCFSLTGWETGKRLAEGLRRKKLNRNLSVAGSGDCLNICRELPVTTPVGTQEETREIILQGKSKYLENSIEESHTAWTERQFETADAIIFIGACGIAVRSIAPFVANKKTDPAVLVIDECGKFVISLLSGHLGGANELAGEAAKILGAIPVITTATDLHHRFAVDVFAKKNNCAIRSMKAAKEVSAALLAGKTVGFFSEYSWEGKLPEGLVLCTAEGNFCSVSDLGGIQSEELRENQNEIIEDKQPEEPSEKSAEIREDRQKNFRQINAICPEIGIVVSNKKSCNPFTVTVHIIPKTVTLGLGCRRGKEADVIKKKAQQCLEECGIYREALEGIASIDLKKEEPGILALAEEWGLDFKTFSEEELKQVPGEFSSSAFVSGITGVDNVCERSAVLASGQGKLLKKKAGVEGVTTALAEREWRICFE